MAMIRSKEAKEKKGKKDKNGEEIESDKDTNENGKKEEDDA